MIATNRTLPYAALVLRVILGVMFLAHGLTKLLVFTPAGTAGFFESIGFPGFLAYPVIAFEVVGGLFLILGVFARWVAAVATLQLLVAASVHFGNVNRPGFPRHFPSSVNVASQTLPVTAGC